MANSFLWINGNNILKDVSLLNSFPNLSELGITGYVGEELSQIKLNLKNLDELYLEANFLNAIKSLSNLTQLKKLTLKTHNTLESIDPIANFNELKELHLETPKLISFPKFKSNNKIETLRLVSSSDIKNLKYLQNLKSLHLTKLISSIPKYLSKNIEYLWFVGDKSELNNISSIKLYKKIQRIRLDGFSIKDSTSTFENIELHNLTITNSSKSSNLSFINSFKSIHYLGLISLKNITQLGINNSLTTYDYISIHSLEGVTNFNNLLNCKISKSLTIQNSDISELPSQELLTEIPNLAIERNKNIHIKDIVISKKWRVKNNGKKHNKYGKGY